MAGVEDFDAARRERQASKPPFRFKLGGKTFSCVRSIPFAYLLQVVEADATTPRDEWFKASCDFIAECLETDALRDQWRKVLLNRDDPIEEWDVLPIVRRLVEVYSAGRPTTPPSDSSRGRPSGGGRSSSPRGGPSRPKKAS